MQNAFGPNSYGLPALPDAELAEKAANFARNSRAASTNRAYLTDWNDFQNWCSSRSLDALPAAPETIGLYLTDISTRLKVATMRRRLVTIGQVHRVARLPFDTKHPAIKDTFAGIRRKIGSARTPKTALVTSDLRKVLATLDDDLPGLRDRAVLLVGFAGAFRRSELVSIEVDDLAFDAKGVAINLRRSKTDQEGIGVVVAIPRGKRDCPVEALQRWLRIARIKTGPVFRSFTRHCVMGAALKPPAIAEIVKRAVTKAGLDPKKYGGHSLRSGFCTSASRNKASLEDIGTHARQKRIETTRMYVQEGQRFSNQAAKAVGL